MRLLEYQAKELLGQEGISLSPGRLCATSGEAGEAAGAVGCPVMVKAQLPSGQRGKGGLVATAASPAEAEATAARLLGQVVAGFPVRAVLVEKRVAVAREYYAAVLTDTSPWRGCPLVLFSGRGGMEIEEIAAEDPRALLELPVDVLYGPADYQLRDLARRAGVERARQAAVGSVLRRLYALYRRVDGELVEVNPLALTEEGTLVALDAKVSTDNNARFRHPEWVDPAADSVEARAVRKGLSYVPLEGEIGLISNGAGLTMATMDELSLAGGRPANFLDAGERILREGIEDGLQLLEERPEIRVIFINIFGGGVQCDQIAQKIRDALTRRPAFPRPVVVCLQGRNAEEGRQILRELPYPYLHLVHEMDAAVQLAVALGGRE